ALTDHVVEDEPGNHERTEHRRDDTGHERYGEALDGADTERVEDHTDEERGDVGVEDRAERFRVAGVDGRLERTPGSLLLSDTLENEHVGVDGHTDRQHDTRDT